MIWRIARKKSYLKQKSVGYGERAVVCCEPCVEMGGLVQLWMLC